MKIRGAKICHAYVLHLFSWKDSLNDRDMGLQKSHIAVHLSGIHTGYFLRGGNCVCVTC